jgi:hypothetical protein
MVAKISEKPAVSTYTREQICASERFRADRDILSAILAPEQSYALQDIEKILQDFKQTRIKEQINGGER